MQSTEDQGSHFTFTVPLDPAPSAPPPSTAPLATLVGKHVLVLDANATSLRILTHSTRKWGMIPHPSASAPEALAALRSGQRFDCAIVDNRIPGLDASTLTTALRGLSTTVPLVRLAQPSASSGYPTASSDEVTLAKPTKPTLLGEALAHLCAHTHPACTPSIVPPVPAPVPRAEPLLLVEDNRVNQRVALHMLTRLGFRADVAGNGLEALDALARQPYDIILMDVQMPEMDGLEATRRIRDTHLGTRPPWIIAITANAMQGDRELCLAAGMDDYVSKPMKPDELAAALARAHRRPAHSRANLACASLA